MSIALDLDISITPFLVGLLVQVIEFVALRLGRGFFLRLCDFVFQEEGLVDHAASLEAGLVSSIKGDGVVVLF